MACAFAAVISYLKCYCSHVYTSTDPIRSALLVLERPSLQRGLPPHAIIAQGLPSQLMYQLHFVRLWLCMLGWCRCVGAAARPMGVRGRLCDQCMAYYTLTIMYTTHTHFLSYGVVYSCYDTYRACVISRPSCHSGNAYL